MYYWYFLTGGIVIGIVVNTLFNVVRAVVDKDSDKQKVAKLESEKEELRTFIYKLKATIVTNKNKIDDLEGKVEGLQNQMNQCFEYFGSIIRHSQEQPYKKEAIKKFLAENGIEE
jgi:peptidoglycan hydrolase CwlO-like protein